MSSPDLSTLLENFHFHSPAWLWLLLALPVGIFLLHHRSRTRSHGLEEYAEPHLLPYLILGDPPRGSASRRGAIPYWALAWVLVVLALASPRWDYREVAVHQGRGGVFILLDLSRSMNVRDLKPSRLQRAKQEITDLLQRGPQIPVALLAFARVPHVVAPLTDDQDTLLNLIPAVDTSLVGIQGTDLTEALETILLMTDQDPGADWDILLLSDGEIEREPPDTLWERLAIRNIHLHVLGVGTKEGAPIPDPDGNWYRNEAGSIVLSRLQEATLRALAKRGGGQYWQVDYLGTDTDAVLKELQGRRQTQMRDRTVRIWEERYYLLLVPLAVMLLPRFRRVGPHVTGTKRT